MPHYFSEDQEGPYETIEADFNIFGRSFSLLTSGGVFSKGHVDLGTEVFLKGMQVKEGSRVLDLGCGYGVIGIVVSKVFGADVVMTDINKRAVHLASLNAKKNKVSIDIFQGDMFSSVKGSFDTVLLNPPQHAGKQVCLDMINGSFDIIKPGGSLQIVARHKKGGKDLSSHMEKRFGNVETVYIKSGFRVYRSIRQQ